nr:YhcH/YjgK/YiaL family protein [uncultured Bacteroides sp.]
MKTLIKAMIACLTILVVSCNTNPTKSPQKQSDIMASSINWDLVLNKFNAKPDSSINMNSFREHYELYPKRWEVVFNYLNNLETDSLLPGTINLSNDIYVTISEYQTKKEEKVLFESHREYIDLQYVIKGKEYIGISHNATENIIPYNKEKDIAFYRANIEKQLLADSTRFFLFFPEDLHQPCINAGQCKYVKKVVIKIKVN